MMNFLVLLSIILLPHLAAPIEWPVFFEQLGEVHSIHNKWDLSLRVHINLPSLQARVLKILHRLDLLNADFADSKQGSSKHAASAGKQAVNSRLDELNSSWNELNRHIRLRCENIQRRSEDLRELGEHVLYRKRRENGGKNWRENGEGLVRRRRQSPGEGLLKGLFGVAYTNDVDSVSNRLNGLDSRLSGDINGVRSQANNIKSSTQEMIERQLAEMRKIETLAGGIERKVITLETNPFMRTSVSDLVHTRDEAYKRLSLEVDLAEERLNEVEAAVTALGSGKLSKSVISPKKLRETLVSIKQQLPDNLTLLFPEHSALWPYYSTLEASAAFDKSMEDVVISIAIPLVDQASILSLHRVHNLPLKVKDGYSVLADITTEYLVTDATRQYYLELFKEDFQDCQVYHQLGQQQFYCGLSPLLRADAARSCVMQLFQGQADPAWCQSRLRLGLVQPFNRLYNGSWVFSAMTEQVPVVLECPEGDTETGLVGFGVLELGAGCTVSSEEFRYAHTFAGAGEVKLGFGSEVEDEDLEGDPEEYDLSRFEGDVLLQEDEVEETTTTAEGVSSTEAALTEVTTLEDVATSTTEKAAEVLASPASKEEGGPTFVYKDLLVRLKDTLANNWIHIA